MTRKEKLEQTKNLLIYGISNKNKYTLRNKKSAEVLHDDKKRLKPASNKSHTKIIQEKLYHRNEVLLNG